MRKNITIKSLVGFISLFALFFILIFYFNGTKKVMKEENLHMKDSFYEINQTQTLKYSFPNRPFDTDVTLEGFGWSKGKFMVVISNKFLNDSYYSYIPRFFSPTLEYKNKKYILMDKVWTEGSLMGYKNSITRYALTTNQESFPKDFWPEKITILGTEYKIPDPSAKTKKVPLAKAVFINKSKLSASLINEKVIYNLHSFESNNVGAKVALNVNSLEADLKEQNIFILKDDHSRIYTFKKSSLPTTYQKGENSFNLELNEVIPNDIQTLEFITFQDDFIQSHLFTTKNEKSVIILQK